MHRPPSRGERSPSLARFIGPAPQRAFVATEHFALRLRSLCIRDGAAQQQDAQHAERRLHRHASLLQCIEVLQRHFVSEDAALLLDEVAPVEDKACRQRLCVAIDEPLPLLSEVLHHAVAHFRGIPRHPSRDRQHGHRHRSSRESPRPPRRATNPQRDAAHRARFRRLQLDHAPQLAGERCGIAITTLRIALHSLLHDGFEIARNERLVATQRHRIAAQHAMERRLAAAVAHKRMHEREAFVERHRQRVDVGSLVNGTAPVDLLRGHVERRANHLARLREPIVGRRQREPEVEHHGTAVRLHDQVLRLEVAVHDAALMRGVQRVRHAREVLEQRAQRRGPIRRRRAVDVDPRRRRDDVAFAASARLRNATRQRVALVERQHEEHARSILEDVEHLGDRRVLQLAEHARLASQPFVAWIVGLRIAAQRLDDDGARESRVLGEPRAPHAAFADHADQLVAANQIPAAEVLRRVRAWFVV